MTLPVDLATLWLFIPAALALNLTPGNDMMLCLGQGLNHGPRAGIAASFGIALGALIHTLLAAFGLATLLAANPTMFALIRWAGVAYLLYLAWRGIVDRPVDLPIDKETVNKESKRDSDHPIKWFKPFKQGLIVNLLNPKVALFILAFLPQFVDPDRGSTVAQFLFLGSIPCWHNRKQSQITNWWYEVIPVSIISNLCGFST